MYDCEMVRDGGGQARFAGLRLIGLGASENRQRSVGDKMQRERRWLEAIGRVGELLRGAPLQWDAKPVVSTIGADLGTLAVF
jgi:hypothetical protein